MDIKPLEIFHSENLSSIVTLGIHTMVPLDIILLYIPSIVFLSLAFSPIIFSDITADREALLRLSSAVQGRTISWNRSSPTPCFWEGISCDLHINRVTELRLPGDGLSGQLPLNTIGNLTALRVLSLRSNSLTGPLPVDIGSSTELRSIHLQDNDFTGELPPSFFQLTNLVRVNLAGNIFSGQITGFSNLIKLRLLYLENNQFGGSISELNSLGGLRQLNISFNRLNGSIPSNLGTFSSESFLETSLCGAPLQSCPNGGGRKLSGGEIALIVIGSVIGLLLIIPVVYILYVKYIKGKTNKQKDRQIAPLPPPVKQPEHYEYRLPAPVENNSVVNQLVMIYSTDDVFTIEMLLSASAELLGNGSTGNTYNAYLENGHEVVVKRLKNVVISDRELKKKFEELGRVAHENLVPLKAYFCNRDEKLLVYESVRMGTSLDIILHENRDVQRPPLTWSIRSKIAFKIATGIEYLHSLGPHIFHGNIKSPNIILRNNYDVLITDYCTKQLVSSQSNSDSINLSQKGDVYSFGVLILELLTGKSPSKVLSTEGYDLPSWALSVVQDRSIMEVFDPELLSYAYSEGQMVRLFHLSINCTSEDPSRRPLMTDVARHIEELY